MLSAASTHSLCIYQPYSTASLLHLPTVFRLHCVESGWETKRLSALLSDDHQMRRMRSPPSSIFLLCDVIESRLVTVK